MRSNAAFKYSSEKNSVLQLGELGQSVWLDYIDRNLIDSGEFKDLVERVGISGLTSNPAIFEKAMGATSLYDKSIRELLRSKNLNSQELFEELAIEDIRLAADVLSLIYTESHRRDGYVSFEVSPYLAHDTEETIRDARRLWHKIGCENLMIKVPGTVEGLPAIRTLLSEGINVNITLLFSQKMYAAVSEAYLSALEVLNQKGQDLSRVASVASFFVSRIDAAADELMESALKNYRDLKRASLLRSLRGEVAIANAKAAYQIYQNTYASERWLKLKAKGAHPQRLLWASTGTKNKNYSDVLYLESLVGENTVTTVPPETLKAFLDHGQAQPTLTQDLGKAADVLVQLKDFGVSFEEITDHLTAEAIQKFTELYDKLMGALELKRRADLLPPLNLLELGLMPTDSVTDTLKTEAKRWTEEKLSYRLWKKDPTVWTGNGEEKWLGWLEIIAKQKARLNEFREISQESKTSGFSHVALLGMGGSSLCPEVLADTLGPISGYPELRTLDSTDPAEILLFEKSIDPLKTLFIISSKSGSTLEPNILFEYFYEQTKMRWPGGEVGDRFIAITDPGSQLEALAKKYRFRHIYYGLASIGGRYSALSDFGLIPAAWMGIDIEQFLAHAESMEKACLPFLPVEANEGARLGIYLGTLGKLGKNKVTLICAPELADLGAWLEQLIAESTGKNGKGLIPITGEAVSSPVSYGLDRQFYYFKLKHSRSGPLDDWFQQMTRAGLPIARIELSEKLALAQELFRWEIAVAVAGSILELNPFDQPDVEASKLETKKIIDEFEKLGVLLEDKPFYAQEGVDLYSDQAIREAVGLGVSNKEGLTDYLRAHLARINPGDYFGILAFIDRSGQNQESVEEFRELIHSGKGCATIVGFGPRFLHSSGQLFKGGSDSGVFLQITCGDARDLPIPGRKATFGIVKAAQARGDFAVLAARGRRVLRVHFTRGVDHGFTQLIFALKAILSDAGNL